MSFERFTKKELKFFDQIMQGFNVASIAIKNDCSVLEVMNYKKSIISKLEKKARNKKKFKDC